MGVGHDHGAAALPRRRLTVVFALICAVFLAEVIGAALTDSLALLTDAGHMLVDVIALALALFAAHLMGLPASGRRTWGLARAEVLAAGVQAALLACIGVYSIWEGISRLIAPPHVAAGEVIVFGVIGLLANIVGLVMLSGSRGRGLNVRAAFMEVCADAAGSVAVIASAIIVVTTGWSRADAVAGLLIGLVILPRAWVILRETASILLEEVPAGIDLDTVRKHIETVPHVLEVHDLHVSRIGSDLPVLTAHIAVEDECFLDGHAPLILAQVQDCLATHFTVPIEHTTVQIERRRDAEGEDLPHSH